MATCSRTPAVPETCAELRCGCGALLARLVDGAIEVKCKRCKSVALFPLSSEDEGVDQRAD